MFTANLRHSEPPKWIDLRTPWSHTRDGQADTAQAVEVVFVSLSTAKLRRIPVYNILYQG